MVHLLRIGYNLTIIVDILGTFNKSFLKYTFKIKYVRNRFSIVGIINHFMNVKNGKEIPLLMAISKF